VDCVNTTSVTYLYQGLINANELGTSGFARAIILGDYLYNNSSSNNVQLNVLWGGSTAWAANIGAGFGEISANRQPWMIEIIVSNRAATNSQIVTVSVQTNSPQGGGGGTPVTGLGAWGHPNVGRGGVGSNYMSIDTTAARLIEFTVNWGTASANNSWRKIYAITQVVTAP
jgi:hypothetical protein